MNRYSIESYEEYENPGCDCCSSYTYTLYNAKVLSDVGFWIELAGGQGVSQERAYEVVIYHLGGNLEYDN